MDLKTWFKGLAVFVASSLVTSVAASSLDPSAFNFSRAGLARMGWLAAVIGAKAVYLYMKQSPVPGTNPAVDWTKPGTSPATDWKKINRAVVVTMLLPLLAGNIGCVSSWERDTYATLATSKAVIDCAVAAYNRFDGDIRHACAADPNDPHFDPAALYLPQTRETQQLIEKARQVQIASVDAFQAYAVAKVAHSNSATIAEKQAAVISSLQQLPALLSAIRALTGKTPGPAVVTTGAVSVQEIPGVMAELKPKKTSEAVHSGIRRNIYRSSGIFHNPGE